MSFELSELETKLKYTFKDKNLLIEALTHPSKKLEDKYAKSFQRLEFLGDKVLNFIIALELFQKFPEENEGQITQRHSHLACGSACFEVAKEIELMPHVIFSKAQINDNSSSESKIGEDVLEAIIGAVFLDSGIEEATRVVLDGWSKLFGNYAPPKDPKSSVQEYFQRTLKYLPQYKIIQDGLTFTAILHFSGQTFSGQSTTKKGAEKNCAQSILDFLNESQESANVNRQKP